MQILQEHISVSHKDVVNADSIPFMPYCRNLENQPSIHKHTLSRYTRDG